MEISEEVALWVRWITFLPLIICSVISVALIISKWLDLRPRRILQQDEVGQLTALIRDGRTGQAAELAEQHDTHASRLVAILVGFKGLSRDAIMARGAHAGQEISQQLEYGLGGLSLVALLGPLFGLLGTVVGIVVVFTVLAVAEGAASPQELAGGIGTALYTTIAGLTVGIIALVAHRALKAKVDRAVSQLETTGLDVIDLLTGEVSLEVVDSVGEDSVPASRQTLSTPVEGEAG